MYNSFLLLSGSETLFGGFKSDEPCLPNRCFSFLKKTSSLLKNFIAILFCLLSSLLNLSHNLVNLFFQPHNQQPKQQNKTKQNLSNCRYLPTTTTTIEFSTLSKEKLDFYFFLVKSGGTSRSYQSTFSLLLLSVTRLTPHSFNLLRPPPPRAPIVPYTAHYYYYYNFLQVSLSDLYLHTHTHTHPNTPLISENNNNNKNSVCLQSRSGEQKSAATNRCFKSGCRMES